MAKPAKSDVLHHLKLLQFELEADNYWTKHYKNSENNCKVQVHLQHEKIFYPDDIGIGNQSTSNFNHRENFVVLECVDRLLRKNYPANRIVLEKTWKVGVDEGGSIDIIVKCKDNEDIYLMIECKNKDKFEDEINNMKNNEGQLFSYFQQDRSASFLCLYSSWIDRYTHNYQCSVVPVTQSLRNARNMYEMYNLWDKNFRNDGIFCDDVSSYQISRN